MEPDVTVADSEPEVVQVEDLAQETPEEAVKEPVVDWQAKFEDSEARRAKELLDWKSQKNELLIKKNLEDMVTQIAEKLQVDASSIEGPVKAVMESSEQERSQANNAAAADALALEVRAIAKEGGVEMTGDDAKRATRIWKHGQNLWAQGNADGAMREFEEAKEEMKDTVERVKRRTEREAAITKEQDDKREEVDSGAVDLTGPRAQRGAGSGASWKQAQGIKNVSDLSDADYAKLIA